MMIITTEQERNGTVFNAKVVDLFFGGTIQNSFSGGQTITLQQDGRIDYGGFGGLVQYVTDDPPNQGGSLDTWVDVGLVLGDNPDIGLLYTFKWGNPTIHDVQGTSTINDMLYYPATASAGSQSGSVAFGGEVGDISDILDISWVVDIYAVADVGFTTILGTYTVRFDIYWP